MLGSQKKKQLSIIACLTLGTRGFLRQEPRNGDKRSAKWRREKREERRGEKTSGCPRQLVDLTAPVDLNSSQDLTLPPDWRNLTAYSDWLLLTDRCVIGCLLTDLVMYN